jgi:hypothetical protein
VAAKKKSSSKSPGAGGSQASVAAVKKMLQAEIASAWKNGNYRSSQAFVNSLGDTVFEGDKVVRAQKAIGKSATSRLVKQMAKDHATKQMAPMGAAMRRSGRAGGK